MVLPCWHGRVHVSQSLRISRIYLRTIWMQWKADRKYLFQLLLSTRVEKYERIKILFKKIKKGKQRKREKKNWVKTSPSVDLVKRLDCCSLYVCWLKSWSQSWSTRDAGKNLQNFCVWYFKIYLGTCLGWEASSLLVEGLRNYSGCSLVIFEGLWHLLRPDSCLTSVQSKSSQ